jgi:diaminopimelate epimerase
VSTIHFYKYQATGNDFVIIDNRETKFTFSNEQIAKICHPKFGVGADGLMLIENHPTLNFHLEYFNSDGTQSLCGNGCRAAVQFASQLGLVNGKASFAAFDGAHAAEILPSGNIRLKMTDVNEIKMIGNDYFIYTGSPHYIRFVSDVQNYPVVDEGKKIRYDEQFKPGGTNVNFVELLQDNTIFVRTYERGVENETLSCGTGITAAALAAALNGYSSPVKINSLGGNLSVEFKSGQSGTFQEIYLVGPAKMVFKGQLEL